MHSLLPDKVEVVDSQSEAPIAVVDLADVIFEKGTKVNTSMKMQDLLYSLGIGHAGSCTQSLAAYSSQFSTNQS